MSIRARNITNNKESHSTTPLPLTIDNDDKKRRKKGKGQLLLFLLLLGVCLQVIIPIGISFSITNSTDFKEVKKATILKQDINQAKVLSSSLLSGVETVPDDQQEFKEDEKSHISDKTTDDNQRKNENLPQSDETADNHKQEEDPPKYNDIIPASSKCSSAIVHDACSRRTLQTTSFNNINVTDWEDTLPPPVEENSKNVLLETGCKTLWFSGFLDHESVYADENPNSYPNKYSVALNSALHHAGDVLQPVLMMGRFGSSRENSTAHEGYGRWAESKGTKVIYVPKLTFHDLVADKPIPLMSAFMRLDIPTFVKEHKLLDMPGVCQRHVFYTDADVIFANPLLESDILMLKQRLEASEEAILSYGREGSMNPRSRNTGVMMIDLKKFEEELPLIFDHGRNMESPPAHDQDLLNHYFFGNKKGGLGNPKLDLLPIGYNWKPYWHIGNASDFEKNVKIIHTHGPKPGRGLEKMSTCDFDFQLGPVFSNYIPFIENGICFDQGRVSRWTIDALKYFKEPSDSWSR